MLTESPFSLHVLGPVHPSDICVLIPQLSGLKCWSASDPLLCWGYQEHPLTQDCSFGERRHVRVLDLHSAPGCAEQLQMSHLAFLSLGRPVPVRATVILALSPSLTPAQRWYWVRKTTVLINSQSRLCVRGKSCRKGQQRPHPGRSTCTACPQSARTG